MGWQRAEEQARARVRTVDVGISLTHQSSSPGIGRDEVTVTELGFLQAHIGSCNHNSFLDVHEPSCSLCF